MTTAQCIFVVWLALGAVTGVLGAILEPYNRDLGFFAGLAIYLVVTFLLGGLGMFYIYLGTL